MARRRKSKLRDKAARHDAAYKRAKQENYAGRAVYKLEEIDKKFRLIRPGGKVLDLGCWPGSWMQYVAEKVGEDGLVYGVDLKEVTTALPPWVHHEVADIETWVPPVPDPGTRGFDVVLSDMAPHTTGDRTSDQWKSEELVLRAMEVARAALRPGGHFVAKAFQGGRFPELLRAFKSNFQESRAFRPQNTRTRSIEQYLVGRGLRASARIDPKPGT